MAGYAEDSYSYKHKYLLRETLQYILSENITRNRGSAKYEKLWQCYGTHVMKYVEKDWLISINFVKEQR